MSGLPQDKQERISALLATLPKGLVDRLCATADKADPALGRLMALCREGVATVAKRRLFEPLQPVSGNPETEPPSKAYTPAPLLDIIYDWLADTVAPDLIQSLEDAVSNTDSEPGQGDLDPVRVAVANAITSAVDAVKDDPKAEKKLRTRLQVRDFEAVKHTAVILRSSPVLRVALAGLPNQIPELTDTLSATLRDRYETASEADPDAAVWLLFLLMARMERPWRMLRVFEKIARRGDDLLVSQTDMATIGDALLDDAAYYLNAFASAPETLEDAQKAIGGLAQFAAVTVGMTREIGIRKDGDWGKHLFELRSKASDQMTRIHQAAKDAFWKVTPEAGGMKRRMVGPVPGLGHPEFVKAEALARFMVATKDDASRAAVGSAHSELIATMNERLETVSQSILTSLRSASEDEAAEAQRRCDDTAHLMRVFLHKDAADILVRRVAAALAA
ncbi:hypothetical protein NHF40_06975 [Maricaulaceae bacterium EIL42A08]|nr:hypothetical protein [Maricaulaceae bacterium EIL42A08]